MKSFKPQDPRFIGVLVIFSMILLTMLSRILKLEARVEDTQLLVNSMFEEQAKFNEQLRGWAAERVNAIAYSSPDDHRWVTLGQPFTKPDVGMTMISSVQTGAQAPLVFYIWSDSGEVLDQFDIGPHTQKGDYVVGWYSKTAAENFSVPEAPYESRLLAYYWNKSSGLAIGVLHVTGLFEGGAIIKE